MSEVSRAASDHSENFSYHLETGDYFGVLSAVMGFLEETVKECTCSLGSELCSLEASTVETLRKDLTYLHEHFQIVPKHDGRS